VLFRGDNRGNLTLYDRMGNSLGETVRSSGRRRKVGYCQRYEYRDVHATCVFVVLDVTMATRPWRFTKYQYLTCWPNGTEVASVHRTARSDYHGCRVEAPTRDALGTLSHRRDDPVFELEDATGRLVARVAHRGWFWREKVDYLVEFLVDELPLELRLVALSAATIADHELVDYSTSGGA
jgi:hypothetical protein